MDCIERIFVLESEQGSAKVVCARENRKNTSMSLMKAIWQKESRQQFLEQTHTKNLISPMHCCFLTCRLPWLSLSPFSMPPQQKDFCSSRRTRLVNYSGPLKSPYKWQRICKWNVKKVPTFMRIYFPHNYIDKKNETNFTLAEYGNRGCEAVQRM